MPINSTPDETERDAQKKIHLGAVTPVDATVRPDDCYPGLTDLTITAYPGRDVVLNLDTESGSVSISVPPETAERLAGKIRHAADVAQRE